MANSSLTKQERISKGKKTVSLASGAGKTGQRHEDSLALLAGMQTDPASLENSTKVQQKIKNTTTL